MLNTSGSIFVSNIYLLNNRPISARKLVELGYELKPNDNWLKETSYASKALREAGHDVDYCNPYVLKTYDEDQNFDEWFCDWSGEPLTNEEMLNQYFEDTYIRGERQYKQRIDCIITLNDYYMDFLNNYLECNREEAFEKGFIAYSWQNKKFFSNRKEKIKEFIEVMTEFDYDNN